MDYDQNGRTQLASGSGFDAVFRLNLERSERDELARTSHTRYRESSELFAG
jgi:hypothetical protein